MPAPCPLCRSDVHPLARAHGRRFRSCPACGLISVAPDDRPGLAAERAHYATHENDPADAGYRAFLDRLARPLADRLAPGAAGLDYGAGPGPTLSVMLTERGFPTAVYDPFFAPDPAPLARTYDFVTCTETAEHFHDPRAEFDRLARLVRPGGLLAVMTALVRPEHDVRTWRYARDPTHVALYRPETMRWIADRYGWSLDVPARDVCLFTAAVRAG